MPFYLRSTPFSGTGIHFEAATSTLHPEGHSFETGRSSLSTLECNLYMLKLLLDWLCICSLTAHGAILYASLLFEMWYSAPRPKRRVSAVIRIFVTPGPAYWQTLCLEYVADQLRLRNLQRYFRHSAPNSNRVGMFGGSEEFQGMPICACSYFVLD